MAQCVLEPPLHHLRQKLSSGFLKYKLCLVPLFALSHPAQESQSYWMETSPIPPTFIKQRPLWRQLLVLLVLHQCGECFISFYPFLHLIKI